ncbi:TetR/AcrR family transcriptional regulator [Amycolatopsis alkalitolerans]|uniref:Helix-turn-helix transcriptional regulator n=1 Tax=Amycolatopsis alkalitolerans TaxID=2547244 RepID=A0A5C4M1A0_9PSEU|nr:TetR/AcrR family transcriptional regulator [Amycolatopsis alkalitolerans]TNC23518.1 helix-turn-helix transcriptional regulator [Amycolatopsis alkalitolerans]
MVAVAEPKRADARRNRARLLAAAEIVLAERGTGAPTEQIAKAAKVGIGTLFRHFPTKESLLKAVLAERMRRFAEAAGEHAEAEDPGSAFFAFLAQWVEMAAVKNAYADALAEVPRVDREVREGVLHSLGILLTRAQEAGAVRHDVGVREVIALMVGTSRAAEHLGEDAALRRRTVEIVFDGLRTRPAPGAGASR